MISPNGFDNLQWFVGIVEDNKDPTNQGRVRVRCFGIHPSYESDLVPTSQLPWAVPINGTYGKIAQIPRKADWVFGFFIDGRDAQHPMLLGTIPGQNLQQPSGSGELNESAYTAPSIEAIQNYGHQPLHPAMSGEDKESTQIPFQNSVRRDGVKIPQEDRGWSEPAVPISGEPQKSSVWYARYGQSYIEINGSDNSEHINISHESGTHVLIDASGNLKLRSIGGDSYYMSEGHSREYVGGRKDVSIEGNWTVNVTNGNAILEVAGDLDHIVHGNYNLNVAGRMAVTVGLGYETACGRYSLATTSEHINLISSKKIKMYSGNTCSIEAANSIYIDSANTIDIIAAEGIKVHSGNTAHFTSAEDMFIDSEKKLNVSAGEDIKISTDGGQAHFVADGDVFVSSSGTVNITGGPLIAADAGKIHLNSGKSKAGSAGEPGVAAVNTPEAPVPPAVPEPVDQNIGLPDSEISPSPGSVSPDALDDDDSSSGAGGSTSSDTSSSGGGASTSTPSNFTSITELEQDPEWNAAMQRILATSPGLTKDEIYRIIAGESGFNSTVVNSSSGATGLFQFIPSTAADLGTSTAEIQNMSPAEQLDLYSRYLRRNNYQGGPLGIMQAAPAFAGRPGNTVVYDVGTRAWQQNPGWRTSSNGPITVDSINAYYSNRA